MAIATADTRRRALAAYERGGKTQLEIAAIFSITVRTFQRWLHTWRCEGRAAPAYSPGRPRIFDGELEAQLRHAVSKNPDATLQVLAEQMGDVANYTTVHRALEAWGLSLKKRHSEPLSKIETT